MKSRLSLILAMFIVSLILPMAGCQSTDVGGLARPLDMERTNQPSTGQPSQGK